MSDGTGFCYWVSATSAAELAVLSCVSLLTAAMTQRDPAALRRDLARDVNLTGKIYRRQKRVLMFTPAAPRLITPKEEVHIQGKCRVGRKTKGLYIHVNAETRAFSNLGKSLCSALSPPLPGNQ